MKSRGTDAAEIFSYKIHAEPKRLRPYTEMSLFVARCSRPLGKPLGLNAIGSGAIFPTEHGHHKMTQYALKQFLSHSRTYLGQQQPKAASSGSPPKLARPEGSRFPSLSGSLPPPISRRCFDPMRRLGLIAKQFATLLKFVSGRR